MYRIKNVFQDLCNKGYFFLLDAMYAQKGRFC